MRQCIQTETCHAANRGRADGVPAGGTGGDIKILAAGRFAAFDDMTWPTAGRANGDLESEMRHGEPTRQDILTAASVLAAYRELVRCPRGKREAVVRRLREAAKLADSC